MDSSELRYVKLDTCLHQFLCHVTFDIKFFHYLFTSYYQILFTLLLNIYEHETTFFEGKSYINLLLNKNSWKPWTLIRNDTTKNTSDGMVTFLVQLQAAGLAVLLKKDSSKICECYKTIFLLSQKTAWQLLHSNKSIQSQLTV